jgi:hypothetical protein
VVATYESKAAEAPRPPAYLGLVGAIVMLGAGAGRLIRGYGWKKGDAMLHAARRRK